MRTAKKTPELKDKVQADVSELGRCRALSLQECTRTADC